MSEEHLPAGCESVEPELNAYVDSELLPDQRALIERHLARCASCQAEFDLLRLVAVSLHQVARLEPSEAMRHRLLAQVAAELPLQCIEIVSTERHGDRVVQRHEVRWSRGPAPLTPPVHRAPAPVVCRLRWTTNCSNCCHMIESYYGGDHYG